MMQRLPTPGRTPVWLGRARRPYGFFSPCEGEEFALLLVLGADEISPDEQGRLSTQFVRQGCRYAVCWGRACSSWDDSIDMVGVMDEIDGASGPFVMTTWHEGKLLGEVAEFFVRSTSFDDWVPPHFVVLVVGGTDELEQEVRAAVEEASRLEST